MTTATSTVRGAWLLPFALYLTVVSFAAGSSSIAEVNDVALKLRWAALGFLAVTAVVVAGARVRQQPAVPGLWFAPLPVGFLLLAIASAAWSVDPSLTLRKIASFAILLVAAAALGSIAALDRRVAGRMLVALVAAAATVALLGLVVLAWSRELALQGLDDRGALRFRGFGGNPNTAAMLYAVALAPAGWLALTARAWQVRAAAGLAVVLFAASLVASLARGAMLAGLFGAILIALTLVSDWRRKAGAMTAILVVFVGGNTIRSFDPGPSYPPGAFEAANVPFVPSVEEVPGSKPGSGTAPPGKGKPTKPGGSGDPEPDPAAEEPAAEPPPLPAPPFVPPIGVRPQDEIGHPAFGIASASAGSGRAAAWKGALADAGERPLLGTGFGTEPLAFTDRWYFFQGSYPENAYLGLLLQLGAVGLAVFLLLGLALLLAGFAGLRRARGEERGLLAATLGAVLAGAVLMVSQSYVYAVGNIATVPFWVCAFMLAAVAGRPVLARRAARGSGP